MRGGFAVCVGDYHADVVVEKKKVPLLTRETVEEMWNGRDIPGVTYPPGGVGLTVSCAMARLGVPVRPLGVIGGDRLGQTALQTLRELSVDTSHLLIHPTRHSITVLCLTDETGERSFCYGDPMENAADVSMTPDQVPADTFDGAALLYVSGIQLVYSPGCDTALALMEQCRRRGIPVALDLNLRTEQYKPEGELLERYLQAVACSDLVFGSGEEEFKVLFGGAGWQEASRKIAAMGKTAVCKMGSRGAAVFLPDGRGFLHRGFPARVVDTIGAGDNFVGAYLARFMEGDPPETCLVWANAAGACSVACRGAFGNAGRERLEEMTRGAVAEKL